MNFNNQLELNQSQKLVMTTQLKQSLSILNMNKLELDEEIKREAEENPLLDVEKTSDINWEEYIRNMNKSSYTDKNELHYNSDNKIDLENIIKYSSSMYEHLKSQISLYRITAKERQVCEYIIDSLDENGYLTIKEEEMIKDLGIEYELYEECILKVQQLDPNGVGARNLSECLIIQMRNLEIYNDVLENIVEEDLNLIALNKYKDISKKYKISIQECSNLVGIIKSLDPRPGRTCCEEKSIYVQPDVMVEKYEDEFIVSIERKDNYRISINKLYKEILKNSQSDKHTKEFIKERLNSAAELIRNIETRKSTILKIAEKIVELQEEFLRNGEKYIKPLKMKDIADELGFHESTISRGVNGKYMMTPCGLYEFKYFFSSSIETEDRGQVSSKSIKKIIKDMIKEESKKKPLSDEQISKILKEKGNNIARRTVSKYREELGIQSSSRRKEY